MLASKCAKCKKHFVGWALSLPEYKICPYCGSKLAIHDETIELDVGYENLLQAINNRPIEWQESLEKTLAVYFRKGSPNISSAN